MSKETEKEVMQLRNEYGTLVARLRKKTKANQEALDRALKRWEDARDQLAAENDS